MNKMSRKREMRTQLVDDKKGMVRNVIIHHMALCVKYRFARGKRRLKEKSHLVHSKSFFAFYFVDGPVFFGRDEGIGNRRP